MARCRCGIRPPGRRGAPRRLEAGYRAGRRHGPTRAWWPNGRLRETAEYSDGALESVRAWDEAGCRRRRRAGAPRCGRCARCRGARHRRAAHDRASPPARLRAAAGAPAGGSRHARRRRRRAGGRASSEPSSSGRVIGAVTRELARVAALVPEPFHVVFADGTRFESRAGTPAFTLRFHTRRAELQPALFGHIGLLDSYFDGDVDIDGDFARRFATGMSGRFDRPNPLVALRNRWHEFRLGNAHVAQARGATRASTTRSAPTSTGCGSTSRYMMYTCGYWSEGTRTRRGSAAQQDRPRVPQDPRCSPARAWSTSAAASAASCSARERAPRRERDRRQHHDRAGRDGCATRSRRRGLGDKLRGRRGAISARCTRQFDKVVSIGVLEHAGRDQLDEVVQRACALPQAGRPRHAALHRPRRAPRHRVLHPQARVPRRLDPEPRRRRSSRWRTRGLEVVDIENLRRHYALTLDAWTERFDANWDAASTRSTRRASTSASAASGARTCSAAPRCSARRTAARTCSRSCSARAISRGQLPDEPRVPVRTTIARPPA